MTERAYDWSDQRYDDALHFELERLRRDRDEAIRLLCDAPVLTGYPDWCEQRDAFLDKHPETKP